MSEYPAVPDKMDWKVSRACDSGACVGVARQGDLVVIGDTADPGARVSRFTMKEWSAFVAGVKLGDFDDLI
jgi:predicted secreted Zn-dependent protease